MKREGAGAGLGYLLLQGGLLWQNPIGHGPIQRIFCGPAVRELHGVGARACQWLVLGGARNGDLGPSHCGEVWEEEIGDWKTGAGSGCGKRR